MRIPDNLIGLHEQEELLRLKALEIIENDSALRDHIATAEVAMDLLNFFVRNAPMGTDDERIVAYLGIRVFNDMGAAWKLIAGGYFQVAAMVQRDVVETVFLLGYFRLKPEMVEVWRTADEKNAITFNMLKAMMTWMERFYVATFSEEAKTELQQHFGA